VPGVIAALLWGFLYSPSIGPLRSLGGINLLGSSVILWSIANIVTWEYAGYNMLILFAALQAIPHDLYEAARIDGASGLQVAWYIKVRLLVPALVLTVVFSIIGTLQLFNEPSIMAQLTTIPSNYTPNLYIYSLHSVGADSYAAALAFVLAAVTFVFSIAFMYVTSRGGIER
jgi:multiple sugar transport system permease protein